MAGLYRRLFTYRERAANSPLENFLTEALADILERVPVDAQIGFVTSFLSSSGAAAFDSAFAGIDRLDIATQVSAASKRPDLVIYAGERPLIVIEVKVGAGLQVHEVEPSSADAEIRVTRTQLESYAEWVARENRQQDAWRGAVVLLTHRTLPPDDFFEGRPDLVFRSVRSWKNVGDWLLQIGQNEPRGATRRDLAIELYQFLGQENLMTKYVSSHDLAAAMLFVSSSETLKETFRDLIKAVGEAFPKLRGRRALNVEFWAEGNIYWGWFYFAEPVKRSTSEPYLAIAICFDVPEMYAADSVRLPAHDPFFMVLCADDREVERPSVFLKSIPEGWIEIDEGWATVAVRPVRHFSADPDARFQEVKDWAAGEVGKLVACIPGYADAPTEPAPAPEEDA